jgi:ABC-2 type transport system permease protein
MTAVAAAVPAPRASDARLLRRWIAARVRMNLRSPRALGFTFAFPLVLVTLFGALNAGQDVTAPSGGDVPFAQYYTPAIGVFAITLACYSSLIIGVATARETGLLKRVRGTPLPLPVYLGAWLTGAALTGIASVAQLTFLPISFISGVWFPITDAPSWLTHLADFFPLKHLVDAFSACFVPGGSVDGGDLLSLAIWGALGMVVAVRRLRAASLS